MTPSKGVSAQVVTAGPEQDAVNVFGSVRQRVAAHLRDVLDGTAPIVGYVTVVETHLLAGLAYRELGDQRAANQAAERALGLAESAVT
jgi:hypothetical protein